MANAGSVQLKVFSMRIEKKFDREKKLELIVIGLTYCCYAPDQITLGLEGIGLLIESSDKNARAGRSYLK